MLKKFLCVLLSLLFGALSYGSYLGYKYWIKETWGLMPRYNYEMVPPTTPTFSKTAVLLFNKTNGFIHREGTPAADEMIEELANALGWEVFKTNNGAIHNAEDLKKFSLIIWNNVAGDVLTRDQREAMKSWIESGGSWMGLHGSGGDMSYRWRWHTEGLVRAQFVGHTVNPNFQVADLLVENSESSLTSHLPERWTFTKDELYAFDSSPRRNGVDVLLTIDESSYSTEGETKYGFYDRMDGDHPMVWRHKIGKGRAFYSALGHRAEVYRNKDYQELIRKAMLWAVTTNAGKASIPVVAGTTEIH